MKNLDLPQVAAVLKGIVDGIVEQTFHCVVRTLVLMVGHVLKELELLQLVIVLLVSLVQTAVLI